MVLGEAVDTNSRVVLVDLSSLGASHALNTVQSAILGQGNRDLFQSVSKSSHGILFHTGNFGALLLQVQGASQLGGASSVDDLIALDEVSDRTEGVVDGSFSLVDDLFTASSHENSHCLGFGALFNDQHAFVQSAEMQFLDESASTQLFRRDFLESGDDTGASGHSHQFDVDAAHPTHSGQFVL